jgi:hypothetical protein
MKKHLNRRNLKKFYGKKKKFLSKTTDVNSRVEKKYNKNLSIYLKKFLKFSNQPSWNKNNSFMFSNRQTLSRLLYINELYKNILSVPGVICEFGVHFGGNLALLSNLRGMYEPYNYTRKIIGFDTFKGFKNDLTKKEKKLGWKEGDYSLPKNYEIYLGNLLSLHEINSPISHKKKFELIKGDVKKTFSKYVKKNPQTLISLAFFDLDLYTPTKFILKRILKFMPKGAIIAFDDINNPDFPGETKAFDEVLGIKKIKLIKDMNNPQQTWSKIFQVS